MNTARVLVMLLMVAVVSAANPVATTYAPADADWLQQHVNVKRVSLKVTATHSPQPDQDPASAEVQLSLEVTVDDQPRILGWSSAWSQQIVTDLGVNGGVQPGGQRPKSRGYHRFGTRSDPSTSLPHMPWSGRATPTLTTSVVAPEPALIRVWDARLLLAVADRLVVNEIDLTGQPTKVALEPAGELLLAYHEPENDLPLLRQAYVRIAGERFMGVVTDDGHEGETLPRAGLAAAEYVFADGSTHRLEIRDLPVLGPTASIHTGHRLSSPPVKLRIAMATDIHEVELPIRFTDLTLPRFDVGEPGPVLDPLRRSPVHRFVAAVERRLERDPDLDEADRKTVREDLAATVARWQASTGDADLVGRYLADGWPITIGQDPAGRLVMVGGDDEDNTWLMIPGLEGGQATVVQPSIRRDGGQPALYPLLLTRRNGHLLLTDPAGDAELGDGIALEPATRAITADEDP